jgi:hypothetical protein
MTRAISAVMHLDFNSAIKYNKLVVIVFPVLFCVIIYDTFSILKSLNKRTKIEGDHKTSNYKLGFYD